MNSELRNALEVLKRNCEKHAGENDCEGCEYDICSDGEVTAYVISNGELDSEVDVNLEALGFHTVEQLVIDLLNNGYKFNL